LQITTRKRNFSFLGAFRRDLIFVTGLCDLACFLQNQYNCSFEHERVGKRTTALTKRTMRMQNFFRFWEQTKTAPQTPIGFAAFTHCSEAFAVRACSVQAGHSLFAGLQLALRFPFAGISVKVNVERRCGATSLGIFTHNTHSGKENVDIGRRFN
jgi:hypothetical protein